LLGSALSGPRWSGCCTQQAPRPGRPCLCPVELTGIAVKPGSNNIRRYRLNCSPRTRRHWVAGGCGPSWSRDGDRAVAHAVAERAAGRQVRVTVEQGLLAEYGAELFAAATPLCPTCTSSRCVRSHPALVRCASRWPVIDHSVTGCQRHHQLHTVRNGSTVAGYGDTLDEASRLGYSKPIPTADVDGFDARPRPPFWLIGLPHQGGPRRVAPRGHRVGHSTDIAAAKILSRTVKLLVAVRAVTEPDGTEWITVPGAIRAISPGRIAAAVGGAFQRGVRRWRTRPAIDFLRPWWPVAPDRPVPCLGDLVAVALTRSRAARVRSSRVRPCAPSGRWARRRPATQSAPCTWPTARRARAGRGRVFSRSTT